MWLWLSGCRTVQSEQSLRRFEFRQPHMGTLFTITLYASDESTARAGADSAFARITALDQMLTDYDPDSELMQLCRGPVGEPVHVSQDLFEVLQESQRIAGITDGAFDVTIGPMVRLWRRARRTETLPTAEQLARVSESTGRRKLKLDPQARTVTLTVPNMQLDLGGIAKGFAADQALAELRRLNLPRALVAASGDIAVGDPPPGREGWRVEVGPLGPGSRELPLILQLRNAAISTSGDTEQFVEIQGRRYSHILDPRTGVGLTNRVQCSVLGKRATDTDAFATAGTVLGPTRALDVLGIQRGLEALIMRREGEKIRIEATAGFPWNSAAP